MGSVLGDKDRERNYLCNACDSLTRTNLGSTVAMCLSARVVARSSNKTTSSTDTRSLCVTSLTTGRAFATSPYRVRTNIDDIILNLNLREEEERKRTVLTSYRKRADIF